MVRRELRRDRGGRGAGKVRLGAETWNAIPAREAPDLLPAGQEVEVERVDGLTLVVRPRGSS